MLEVKFDIKPPLEHLKYYIRHIENEVVKDLSEFYEHWMPRLLKKEIGIIFATEGYGQWAPLSPAYAAWKSRHHPGRKMLRLSDAYFRAATRKGARGNLFVVTPQKLIWGIDLDTFTAAFGAPYPYYMERGVLRITSKKGFSVTPARPVFYLASTSQRFQEEVFKAFGDYLTKVIDRETRKYF